MVCHTRGPSASRRLPASGERGHVGEALTASRLRRPRSHRRAASSRRRTLPDGGRMSHVTPHSLRHAPLQGLRMATCPARLARGRRCPDGVPWTSPNSRPRMDTVAVPAPLWAGSETPPSLPPPRPSGTRKARQPLRGCWAQPRPSPRAGGRAGCGFQDSDGSSRCEQDGNEDAGLLP